MVVVDGLQEQLWMEEELRMDEELKRRFDEELLSQQEAEGPWVTLYCPLLDFDDLSWRPHDFGVVLYRKDGGAYLTNGDKTVCLKGHDMSSAIINGMFSGDRNAFYYIADMNKKTRVGRLMMVDMSKMGTPVVVAEHVGTAATAQDGPGVMYTVNVTNDTGSLYVYKLGKKPVCVANNASPYRFGFSPDGNSIYYTVIAEQGGKKICSLYVKKDGHSAVKADEVRMRDSDRACFGNIHLDNDGQMLYLQEHDHHKQLYTADGSTQNYEMNLDIVAILGSTDNFCFFDEYSVLKHKAPGKNPVSLTEEIVGYKVTSDDRSWQNTERILMSEYEKGETCEENAVLYELGSSKVRIADMEGDLCFYDAGMSNVVFNNDGKGCIVSRTKDGWSEPIELGSAVEYADFDASGSCVYYIYENSFELFQYTLSSGEKRQLMKDALYFYVCKSILYVLKQDSTVCRIQDGKCQTLGENIDEIWKGIDGVFLTVREESGIDIYFAADEGGEMSPVCTKKDLFFCLSFMEFYPPIPEDSEKTLGELCHDARICMALMDGDETGEVTIRTAQENIALVSELIQRNDISYYVYTILYNFNEGFKSYKNWMNNRDDQEGEWNSYDLRNAIDRSVAYIDLT